MIKYINERLRFGEAPRRDSGKAIERCACSSDPGWIFVFIAFIVFIVFIVFIAILFFVTNSL
jgi:hypothetical protein